MAKVLENLAPPPKPVIGECVAKDEPNREVPIIETFVPNLKFVKSAWCMSDEVLTRELFIANRELTKLFIFERLRLAEAEFPIGEPVKLREGAARLEATELMPDARTAEAPELPNECQPLEVEATEFPAGVRAAAGPELPNECQPLEVA